MLKHRLRVGSHRARRQVWGLSGHWALLYSWRRRDRCLTLPVPEIRHDLASSRSLLSEILVVLCCIGGLMQHVCNRTGLRFVLVGGSPHFLPRPLNGSVSSPPGVVGHRRDSS